MTGITGTDGKTSTTELLRAILNEAGCHAGSVGTLGYCFGGRWVDSDLTTPDPIALHGAFRRMVDFGLTDACMEVSSHSLIQQRVADVRYDAAVADQHHARPPGHAPDRGELRRRQAPALRRAGP